MPISNITNLPPAVVNLANYAWYESKGDISTTRLIKPERLVTLYERHKAEITVDVQDLSWSILGSAVHVMLERSAKGEVIAEQDLYMQVNGWTVKGTPDIYYIPRRQLQDYKVTSVWVFLLGSKIEWEQQLNINAMLHRIDGQPVDEIQIVAILRDWMKQKADVDLRYPQHQIHVAGIPIWEDDQCMDFIHERVKLHQAARELPDDELPLCTPKERWYRTGGWPVMKNGNKKADRLCDTEKEALEYMHKNQHTLKPGRYFVTPLVEREGVNVRCEDYCEARQVCPFAKRLREKAAEKARRQSQDPALVNENEDA